MRNVVAELTHGVSPVSIDQAVLALQLHNVESSEDPFSDAVKVYLEAALDDQPVATFQTLGFKIDLFRTLLLICKSRTDVFFFEAEAETSLFQGAT